MAHLLRAQPDSVWKRGYVTIGNDLKTIDQNTFLAINGDDGGTWSPSTPITIAGAGVVAGGPWTMSGAALTATTSAGKAITFGKGDATDYYGLPAGHPGETFSTYMNFVESFHVPIVSGNVTNDGIINFLITGSFDPVGIFSSIPGVRLLLPLRVFSGAPRINTVTIDFIVYGAHANVPQVLPRARVIAVAVDGTVIPQRARDTTTDADGFQNFPTPASGAAWVAANAVQTYVYACNVVQPVDSGAYLYFLEIIDEAGTNTYTPGNVNRWLGANVAYTGVSIFDGRS